MKLVINTCYGGFSLSTRAINRLKELEIGEKELDDILYDNSVESRSNNLLVRVVEWQGEEANSDHSQLKIVRIPDDAHDPYIVNYDGMEHIAEGRCWY
jgi:hypothetical protein